MSNQQIYTFFRYTQKAPTMLGTLHILSLILTLALTILFCVKLKNASEKKVRFIIFLCWLLLLMMETYRQICYSISIECDKLYWNYDWGQFPLQVCSVQLYALPFIVLLPEGRLRAAFICVMMSWSIIGGLGVTIYPGNTYIDLLGITIQSVVHHGIQAVLGIFLAFRYGPQMKKRDFLYGFILFSFYSVIAMLANIIGPELLSKKRGANSINMFFLSPYHSPLIDLLGKVRDATSHAVMVIIYMGLFHIASATVFQIELCLTSKIHSTKEIQYYENNCKNP